MAADNVSVEIEGKGVENRIIKLVESLITPRIPTILQNAINNQLNPYLSKVTANEVSDVVSVGTESYVIMINTT